MDKKVFIKNCCVCLVKQDIGEPPEHHAERGMFIVSQTPKDKLEYNEFLKYSRIYINKKYNKCVYNTTIMKKLDELLLNCN